MTLVYRVACLAVVSMTMGCARYQTWQLKREVQETARRWCLTIRASQVLPVYPLTEDIQPGDVFLVQTPIPLQAKAYNDKGYLPLDIQLHRLGHLKYEQFYADGYFKGHKTNPDPHARPEPVDVKSGDSNPVASKRFTAAKLPAAAFPDYGFEVTSGTAAKLALPISGVPVGLGFMGASKVTGTVKLSEAFTYAIDDTSLLAQLKAWAEEPSNRTMLADIRRGTRSPLYLRVVSRVYLVGGVDVSLAAQGASSGKLDVGAAKSLDPMALTASEAKELRSVAADYQAAASAFTKALNDSLPGGSVQFAAANRNYVTMHENFGRLLAVGYLGFDVQVDEDGVLGAPVATQDILTSPSNSVKRLNPSLSTASRQVVESVVIDLYQNVIEPNSGIGSSGKSNHHFAEAKRLLDAFGDGIRIATDLVEQERRSSSKDVPLMLQPKGTNSIKQTMAVQNLLGFNRYIYYKSAIEGSLTATKDQLVADPNDKVALGLQKHFAKCADQLAQEYKASQHVNLALKRFYLGLYE